jgi:thiamine biosynthesis lipoprotein
MDEVHERTWRAMGTSCHAMVLAASPAAAARALDRVVDTVEHLEGCWSRFRPGSDVSRINHVPGQPVAVADETLLAVEAALEARRWTAGRFDPTVLGAVVAAGYDRDFAAVVARATVGAVAGSALPAGASSAAGAGVHVDPDARTVTVAAGHGLDLGGIGKGLAADLAASAALAAGAGGACVNLGGDLRATGGLPSSRGWGIAIDDPLRPAATIATVDLAAGGLATSSTCRRRWRRAGGTAAHHVIDPATGAPADSDVAAATVLAGSAVEAEAMATAVTVAGVAAGAALLEGEDLPGLIVSTSHSVHCTAAMEPFLR